MAGREQGRLCACCVPTPRLPCCIHLAAGERHGQRKCSSDTLQERENGKQADPGPGVLLPHAALLSDRLHFFPLSHKLRAGAGGGPRAVTRPLSHRRGPGMSYEERAPWPGLHSRAPPRGRWRSSLRRAVFLPFPPRTVLQPQQGPPAPPREPAAPGAPPLPIPPWAAAVARRSPPASRQMAC